MTALHWAARRGEATMVRMLLAAGANVRATTQARQLHTAAAGEPGRTRAGASTRSSPPAPTSRATTAAGVTPLMLASASGQVAAVKALVAHGADVNAAEPTRGETALMFAAANRRTDVVRALIAAKANVNAATKVVSLKAAPPSPEEEAYLAARRRGRAGGRPAPGAGESLVRAQGPAAGPAQPRQAASAATLREPQGRPEDPRGTTPAPASATAPAASSRPRRPQRDAAPPPSRRQGGGVAVAAAVAAAARPVSPACRVPTPTPN